MRWADAQLEAMVLAASTRETAGIDGSQRVDIFEAVAQQGLKLMFRPLRGIAGFYEPPSNTSSAGVLVNSDHPLALQRFSAAHEYGHHLFGHGRRLDLGESPPAARDSKTTEERLAESFAAWFLMPPEGARTALARMGLDAPLEPKDVYGLALRLGVSYSAACAHLPSLKLVTQPRAASWAAIPPKQLKVDLSSTPPPGGWRCDVWELHPSDAQTPIYARAGDRLLLPSQVIVDEPLPPGITLVEIAPTDLLGRGSTGLEIAVGATPGQRAVAVRFLDENESGHLLLDLQLPLRGRYFPQHAQ